MSINKFDNRYFQMHDQGRNNFLLQLRVLAPKVKIIIKLVIPMYGMTDHWQYQWHSELIVLKVSQLKRKRATLKFKP